MRRTTLYLSLAVIALIGSEACNREFESCDDANLCGSDLVCVADDATGAWVHAARTCQSEDTVACRRCVACQRFGRCTADDGVCVTYRNDCARTDGCRDEGLCGYEAWRCTGDQGRTPVEPTLLVDAALEPDEASGGLKCSRADTD